MDINVRWLKKNEERKSKTGERDRWPRMKMTGEKEPREREDDRVANGDDWLSGRETGDIRVNYGQPQDLLVSR